MTPEPLNIAGIVGVRAAGASVRMAGVQGAGMSIALCTHPARCEGMEAAHSVMAGQLADALAELSQARAQLATAQQQLEAAQAAYQQAKADAAFHMAGFVDECKRKAVTV